MIRSLDLRPARLDDAGALADIGYAAWEQGRLSAIDAGRVDRTALRNAFLEFCRADCDTIIVAVEAGRPLGWGAREARDDYISDLWVSPLAQGRGVGAALLARLEDDIASAGYRAAKLSTLAANLDAIRFYRRHGYGITAEVNEYSVTLGYEIDKVRMAKPLLALAGTDGRQEENE